MFGGINGMVTFVGLHLIFHPQLKTYLTEKIGRVQVL